MRREIIRKKLLNAAIGGKSIAHVEIRQIDFAPLQETGLHFHPCDVVGYIAKGTALFQIEGEAAKTLKAGDAFHEPKGRKILHFDNASDQEPLTFIAFYLLGAGESELITMLE